MHTQKLVFCFFLALNVIQLTQTQEQNTVHTPTNTRFLFDVNRVIITPSYTGMLSTLWFNEHSKLKMMWDFASPSLWYNIVKRLRHGGGMTEIVTMIKTDYPHLQKYLPLLVKLNHQQKPIEGTVEVITKLKKLGYQLDIGTNMDSSLFVTIKRRMKNIFNNFTNFHAVDSNVTPIINKPNPLFFERYLQQYPQNEQIIIFIDDRLENVQSAESMGLLGIHFKNTKQIKKDLKKIGIL